MYEKSIEINYQLRLRYDANTNGSPGFTQEVFDILKKKSEAAGDKKIYATLMMDEICSYKKAT